jgi:outer membrane protein OmpA-like peptidoglycan-associated protein
MLGTVLRDAGIAADRMSMRGVGESSPVASNQSAEDRALIRRVEIVLSDGVGPQRPR